MAEISTLLQKETIIAHGECRKNFNDTIRFLVEHYPNVDFTKFKVQRVINLFEDTGNVHELNYLAKISRSCFSSLWKNESIQCNKLRPNVVCNFVSVYKVREINVKYVTWICAKKGDQNSAFVSYASTFLHLQPRLTQFFLFSCKPDVFQGRVSPYSIFY
jgi:hypothetical protein